LPVDLLSTDKIICSGEEIKIFDLNTGECLKTIHHRALFSVKVISNELIMIGTKEGELKVLNIVTGLCTHKFKGFFDCIIKLTVEHIAYVCSRDSTKIKIWNINSGERKTILTSHTGQISMLAKSSDNKIISCSNDKTIKEWDIETGQCLNILNFNSIYIYTK
jgi:WD40 repeat protein